MSIQSGEAVQQAASKFAHRQRWVLIGLYVVLLVVSFYSVFVAGFWVNLAVFFGLVSVVLPAFTFRSEDTIEADEPPGRAVERFSSPRNVLTAVWFEQADEIEADTSDGSATVRVSPRIGGERRYRIETEDTDETIVRLSISRDGDEFVETTIDVREAHSGSEISMSTLRRPVSGLWLLQILVLGPVSDELLSAAGYHTIESAWSVRPRNPLASREAPQ